jgi:zinc protease
LKAQDVRISVPYTQFVLPNGLNVILHEDHTTPTVSVNVWYHVGSGREKPGRTGFAHLFEHIMFEGSGHVAEGNFDQWLEAAGGNNNGSTTNDRTNYWEDVPSNALELALFLESDRMGYLLQSMSPDKVNGQRDVVKNERRQSYENQPYGMASIALSENLYPANHPYHWPTIGYMDDLTAASYEDVVGFFKSYYGPNNASLVVAGDIDPAKTRTLIEKWFRDVPAGESVMPLATPAAALAQEKRVVIEDQVQLPRLYMAWLSPGVLKPGDAELDVLANVLAGGKNSRLYKRLVYDLQIAQDVQAFQASSEQGSNFQIRITARPGHALTELEQVAQEELDRLKREPPTARELGRAVNQYEAGFLDQLEQVGSFGGKADQLNHYFTFTGNPDYFNEDLARYKALSPEDVSAVASRFLRDDARVILSVVPRGKTDLQAQKRKTSE